ncbi:hypothetical protein DFQ26_002143 [Actinomortierella ambigua]|nr:hypothetical protein DFQ26_002143 [Actinomortierella ambigua]
MLRSAILLFALLCAQLALVEGRLTIRNRAGREVTLAPRHPGGFRNCFCLTNSDVVSMTSRNVSNLKLYLSNDCTGQSQPGPSTGNIPNAGWANSVSYGTFPPKNPRPSTCPNYFA